MLIYHAIIGIIAGFLAGKVMKGKGFGLIVNLIIGIGGAILGGILFGLLNIDIGFGFIGSIISAFVGSVLLLLIIGFVKKNKSGKF